MNDKARVGAALWILPALLFAPGALGDLPYDAGLLVMIAAAVNVHHFILDGAIWKLRDGRIARILIRDPAQRGEPEVTPAATPAARGGWLRTPAAVLIWSAAPPPSELKLRARICNIGLGFGAWEPVC